MLATLVVLWAWESPQDLRFLDTRYPVAYYAGSVYLRADRVLVRSRMQPVRLTPKHPRMPVIRMDADPKVHISSTPAAVLAEIRKLAGDSNSVQIDFDARVSEREFYRRLLAELRPSYRLLSMTALVSWCNANSWLKGLPVDEIVPMEFRAHGDKQF